MDKNSNLTKLCKENIQKLCDVFDNEYSFVLRNLLYPLKQKSDALKMDYSYYRYKTMAMATHTPTTIPPTFAGYFGYISSDNDDDESKTDGDHIDMTLWKIVVDALQDDIDNFMETVNNILKQKTKKRDNLLNIVNKMAKKETHFLRILDNICYNSVCAMIMYQSYIGTDEEIKMYHTKLMKMRQDICNILETLSGNSLLFCKEMDGLHHDVLHSCFLTYDKEGKKVWSVHLMSGILLNYWVRK